MTKVFRWVLVFWTLVVGIIAFGSGCSEKKETQMDIAEVQQMLARFKEAELKDSKKSFAECLARGENGKVTGAHCYGNVVTARDIASLSDSTPTQLTFWHCKFEGDVVTACAAIASLEELTLFGCPVQDEQMLIVSRLTNLKKLDVRQTPITDEGLVAIGSMMHLKELVLLNTKCSGPRFLDHLIS